VVTVAEILVVGQVATSGAASDIAFGPDGTLYAADPYPQDNSLLTFDGSGQAVIWSGGSAVGMDQNGPRTSARFDAPYALTFVGDTLYVAESGGHVIRQIDGSGQVTTFCGTGVNGFADGNCSTAQFDTPTGIVADAQGDLFVADSYNHRIRKIDTSGHVTTWAGQTQSGLQNGTGIQARLNYPIAVAIDDQGNLFVADSGNMAIRKIDPSRDVTTFALMPLGSPVPHGRPYGVAVDAQGNVYAADLDNGGIDRFAANGTLTAQVTDSNLQSAAGMAFDSQGRLFATGMGNGAVVQVDIP
jgi:sugar lactone lactonase YvrE